MISEPEKTGMPQRITSPRDKVVQEAVRIAPEGVYESTFLDLDYSHGFGPNRGCYMGLEFVTKKWTGISWLLELDIEKGYDSID